MMSLVTLEVGLSERSLLFSIPKRLLLFRNVVPTLAI